MALKLMYITNNPQVAGIASDCGVDRIFVDMEYIGKEDRQRGLNTVKSFHTVKDVEKIKNVLTNGGEVLARINPIIDLEFSKKEINDTISAGADIIMLPMVKTVDQVKAFVDMVGTRAKAMLLIETAEANEGIDGILDVGGIDEFHVGLNDLHLAYNKKFMFEVLTDGTVERLCERFAKRQVPYGFGGIARLGHGILPAEKVIAEHYRLGSTMAILSRSFCNLSEVNDMNRVHEIFHYEMKRIREYENLMQRSSAEFFEDNKNQVKQLVEKIAQSI